jgi:hypothetical protein
MPPAARPAAALAVAAPGRSPAEVRRQWMPQRAARPGRHHPKRTGTGLPCGRVTAGGPGDRGWQASTGLAASAGPGRAAAQRAISRWT